MTTGYSWEFGTTVDAKHPQIGELQTIFPPIADLTGASGTQVWVFEALQPGTTTITLEYVRVLGGHEPPIRTAVYTIHVQ